MHLNDNTLRAYLDQELNPAQTLQAQAHVSGCADCQQRLGRLSSQTLRVQTRLHRVVVPPLRSSQAAYRQFQLYRKDQKPTMNKKRTLFAAIAALTVLVLFFTLTPASAWASNFLGMFRVQKVTVLSFDPNAVQKSRDVMAGQQNEIQSLLRNQLTVTTSGKAQEAASPAAAAQLAGFTPRLLNQSGKLVVKPAMHAELTIKQPEFQALLDAANIKAQIPAEVDGKIVKLDVPTSVIATYGDCPAIVNTMDEVTQGGKDTSIVTAKANAITKAEAAAQMKSFGDCTTLMQLASPTVDAPQGLDIPKLGAAMFQFLGLPEDQATQLANNIDWTTTLVLPIPQGEGVSYQEMSVDGVTGTLLLIDQTTASPHYALIWTKNGMLYSLTGAGSLDQVQKTVSTLQ